MQWEGLVIQPQRTPGLPRQRPYSTQVLPGCRYWGRTPSLRGGSGPVYQPQGAGHMLNWVCTCAPHLLGPPGSSLPLPLLGLVESTVSGPPSSWNFSQDDGIYTVSLSWPTYGYQTSSPFLAFPPTIMTSLELLCPVNLKWTIHYAENILKATLVFSSASPSACSHPSTPSVPVASPESGYSSSGSSPPSSSPDRDLGPPPAPIGRHHSPPPAFDLPETSESPHPPTRLAASGQKNNTKPMVNDATTPIPTDPTASSSSQVDLHRPKPLLKTTHSSISTSSSSPSDRRRPKPLLKNISPTKPSYPTPQTHNLTRCLTPPVDIPPQPTRKTSRSSQTTPRHQPTKETRKHGCPKQDTTVTLSKSNITSTDIPPTKTPTTASSSQTAPLKIPHPPPTQSTQSQTTIPDTSPSPPETSRHVTCFLCHIPDIPLNNYSAHIVQCTHPKIMECLNKFVKTWYRLPNFL